MTEETLFTAALERATPADRAAFLDQECAGDAALRRRVEALLWSHESAQFMKTPAIELGGVAMGETTTAATDGNVESDSAPLLGFLAPSQRPGSVGRLDHYEVHEVIGHGGMGVVLRAFDERLHRVVAIKVMAAELATSATARRRFTREAQAAAAVSHDHIVTIHAVEEADGLPFLVMQYVTGMSLQERLDADGPLELAEILRIGLQTAAGLAAAHAQGLVHRDIKPANILLENGVERVKITDFGLARAVDDASLTQSGVVAGTPQYMSPEQAEGKVVDVRTDLFSLGSVLYAMCTGRAPFRANGTMAVLKRVCEDAPSPVREANPEIPDWLVAIIEKLHAKDPAGRYQSAAVVAEILGQHLARLQHPTVTFPPLAKKAAGSRPERRRRRWALLAAGLICTVAGIGVSEATGVTNVGATVIRILTPDGTLVIEANDPSVIVTIEGDRGVAISGAGAQAVRLRPGSYQVHATKDGRVVPLDRDLVTITRSDRQIVKVRLEGALGPFGTKIGHGSFVVLGSGDAHVRTCDTLVDAVEGSSDGDTIEIRGNGPFLTEAVTISDRRALTIRAGNGFRPVLRLAPGLGEDQPHLLSTCGPLVLEGLEIQCERMATAKTSIGFSGVASAGGVLRVANCRFVTPLRHAIYAPRSPRAIVRNCEFLCSRDWCDALTGECGTAAKWEVENCVQVGGALVSCGAFNGDARDAAVQIRRCSLIACVPVFCYFHTTPRDPDSGRTVRLLRAKVVESLIDSGQLLGVHRNPGFLDKENPLHDATAEDAIPRLISWHGTNNVHHRLGNGPPDAADAMIWWGSPTGAQPVASVNDLASWRKFWGSPETGCIQSEIRYQGGDLASRLTGGAVKLTPDDFRLRPDSAGYRARSDGKDIGADVDLLGPGPAYERWKKTPGYQQWLKERG